MDLYKAMQAKSQSSTLNPPRLGGLDKRGVWVGSGANGLGKKPKSSACMREFKTDPVKNHTALQPIEDKCTRGLRDVADKYFCLHHESNADQFVQVLYEFRETMILCGMEGVFNIIKPDLTEIDMLKTPGMVDEDTIKTWCKDLLEDGVAEKDKNNPDLIIRHAVCEYDETNLAWSGQALLNSCSDALSYDLRETVPVTEHTGPQLMMALLSKIYRPSQAKIRRLRDQLEALRLNKIPGESVTLYRQKAEPLCREIIMNSTNISNVPDLATTALFGLTFGSDSLLNNKVRELRIATDVNGFGGPYGNKEISAFDALKQIEDVYRVLVNSGDYAPAKLVGKENQAQALQAQIEKTIDAKLKQDRDASSTKGNSTGNSSGGAAKRDVICWTCGEKGHIRGDPACKGKPKPDSDKSSSDDKPAQEKRHDLSDEVARKVNAKAKEIMATMPKREHIPDDADLVIKDAEGKVCAKYCRHCNIYTKGYTTAHFTREHKGSNNLCPYIAPPESGTAAPLLPSTAWTSPTFPSCPRMPFLDSKGAPTTSTPCLQWS